MPVLKRMCCFVKINKPCLVLLTLMYCNHVRITYYGFGNYIGNRVIYIHKFMKSETIKLTQYDPLKMSTHVT